LGLTNHFIQEGLAYRFTPFELPENARGNVLVDTDKMYDNLMHKFKFGGIDKPGIYLDENILRMCFSHRRLFTQLAAQLITEGKKEQALAVLDYAERMIPAYNVPYDAQNGADSMAESYYQLGETAKADAIIKALADNKVEYITWYLSLNDYHFTLSASQLMRYHLGWLDEFVKIMTNHQSAQAALYTSKSNELYGLCVERLKRLNP
jgi:hypothetical protein